MLSINDLFPTIEEARDAINRHVLDEGESYKVYKSDSRRHIIICKETACKFRIRASLLKKKGVVITVLSAHSCSPATHYKNKQSSSLWFLKDHHRASIIDDRTLTPAQIQSNERLRFNNTISYRQAHRLKQAILDEIDGLEADCFAQFPAYIESVSTRSRQWRQQLSSSCFCSSSYEKGFSVDAEVCSFRCLSYKIKVSNDAYDSRGNRRQ
jgi:hypothetical protein